MVDWDRVEELRAKGWDWDKIAEDPKVGFHPDASVQDEGRALRGLYHRQRLRRDRQAEPAARPSKKLKEEQERKWTLPRIGFLAVPVVGIWLAFAYFVPSPVGIIVPAWPWLALVFAAALFILFFGLWRTSGPRWTKAFRTAAVVGIVFGLVVSGVIALAGVLIFGCPVLPSASSLTSEPGPGWAKANVPAWQDGGKPVLFFYGATWCPYCSASSWAIWKSLMMFQKNTSINGAVFQYSSSDPAGPYTPEVNLGSASVASTSNTSFIPVEDQSGIEGNYPGTANCFQQAYVSAYANGIPFIVVNGQYIHTGTLVAPTSLSSWANGAGGGTTTVAQSVQTTSGTPWSAISTSTFWLMAYMAKATGVPIGTLASENGWPTGITSSVTSDYNQIS